MSDNTEFISLFLAETSLSSNCLKSNLKYVDESRVFQNSSENSRLTDLISTINAKLHASGSDRSKALLLLEKLLPQCPADLYNDYSAGWMQQCSRWNQRTIDDELRILRYLIEKSVSSPEGKKVIITNILPRFAERLRSVDKNQKSTQTVINTLQCLRSFIHCYSSACGPHRGIFQKYVTHCLTERTKNVSLMREAAASFVALCECGPKGLQGINFKEAWSSKFSLLVKTCHKLLDSLYSNVNFVGLVAVKEIEEYLPEFLEVTANPDITPVRRYHLLLEKFVVLAELLQAMLLCKYSTSKSFQPNDMLNLTCRVLSVNGNVLKNCVQTNDILALFAIVPELHESAFDIILALIKSVRRNLIPQASLICTLCLQSLKWTHSNEWLYGSQKPFQSLRCKVYSVLSSWMSVVGSCSFIEIFAEEIIPIIIADIEFAKPSVKLTVTTKPNTKKGKSRKRGAVVTEMNMQSDSTVFVDRKANARVCMAAHETLQLLLSSASVLIKWEHHKHLQYVIIPLLTEMLDCLSPTRYPLPYSDSKCRLNLFASLVSLVQNPHPKWTAPLSLAIGFLTTGTRDENVEVASFCRTALCQVENNIHPRCPSLYFPLESGEKPSNSGSGECPLFQAAPSTEAVFKVPFPKTPVVTVGKSSLIAKSRSITEPSVLSVVAGVERAKLNESVVGSAVNPPQTQVEHTSSELQESSSPTTPESTRIESSLTNNLTSTSLSSGIESASVTNDFKSTSSPTGIESSSVTNDFRSTSSSTGIESSSVTNDFTSTSSSTGTELSGKSDVLAEPLAKKSKLSSVNQVDEEKVEKMLNDFVDTWE